MKKITKKERKKIIEKALSRAGDQGVDMDFWETDTDDDRFSENETDQWAKLVANKVIDLMEEK
jgi:hypothetical protein